ncbi:hypothetical protein DWU98_13380 [Dyella monticola]|uniref:Dicarboxylate transport domain-containing protein n=1 Tax=Dyella monticola TaxID=1927958 RepID=A0A370WWB9_9GAMM|nr:hypothetical protein [Dyella monticola]RDS80424.1 hypothetical protein DWU98_13380 [Dyella monticola]
MFSFSRQFVLCAFCTLLWAVPAWADTVVTAKRIDMPGASLQDVRAQLAPGATPDTVRISLHAGKADIPALGWRKIAVALDGSLHRDAQMRWLFDGTAQLSGTPGGALSNAAVDMIVDDAANTLEVNASQGAASIETAFPLDQPTHAQINLRNLPAGWLQGLLGTVWAGRISNGKLDAELALDATDQGFQSSGDITFADIKYATSAGNVAGQGLDGHARFSLDANAHPAQLTLNGGLRGGELQLGPVLAKFPAHEVAVDFDASTEHGGLSISHLHMDDADALALDGALAIDAKGTMQKLRLDHFQARFPAAYDRYGQPWMDDLAAPNLVITGELDGHVDYTAENVRSFDMHTDGLDVADSTGQLKASGLHGELDWSAQSEKPATTLAWNQLIMRQITMGAAQSHWRSHGGTLSLQSPLAVGLWKGQVRFTKMDWRPAAPKATRLDVAATAGGIDMAALNQALGWLPFPGTLNGAISALQWTGDRYALDGDLTINAFGGTAVLDRLTLRGPLSSSPMMGADVTLRQIDLAPLADTFNFGAITGRLDGTIDALELTGGSAVAFKASLLAQNGGHISLRAANNLSIITGGNPASGLQSAMMKLFKSASYKRMGINASLQDGVCTLSGLDSDASGYSIVEGSGLPYMHVTGTQSRIDWPVLVHRLKTAAQGTVAER